MTTRSLNFRIYRYENTWTKNKLPFDFEIHYLFYYSTVHLYLQQYYVGIALLLLLCPACVRCGLYLRTHHRPHHIHGLAGRQQHRQGRSYSVWRSRQQTSPYCQTTSWQKKQPYRIARGREEHGPTHPHCCCSSGLSVSCATRHHSRSLQLRREDALRNLRLRKRGAPRDRVL